MFIRFSKKKYFISGLYAFVKKHINLPNSKHPDGVIIVYYFRFQTVNN